MGFETQITALDNLSGGTSTEYEAGLERGVADGWLTLHESGTFGKLHRLDLAIANGWLDLHESGTYVKLTEAGATLLA